jgi:hypothetical protein
MEPEEITHSKYQTTMKITQKTNKQTKKTKELLAISAIFVGNMLQEKSGAKKEL